MDPEKRKLFTRADSRFGILLLLCLVLPLLVVAMGVANTLEQRSLEQAHAHLEAGAEDYAVSLLRRLEFAESEIRYAASRGVARHELRLVKDVRPVAGDLELASARLRPLARGFQILVPVAGQVMRGEISDTVLFAELGHAASGVSRCIHLNGVERVCDRGLRLSGTDRVNAQYTVPLGAALEADFELSVRVAQPKSIALRSVAFVREFLPYTLVGLSLFAGVLLFVFFRRRLRPAATVARAMGDMSEGAFLQQVHIDTGDVFEKLGREFNAMSHRVHASIGSMLELAELDRLILSGADPQEIARQVLGLAERATGLRCCICLRDETPSHGMLLELEGEELNQVDVRLPNELNSGVALVDYLSPHFDEPIGDYFSVVHEGLLSGVLMTKGGCADDSTHRKILAELVDRISVAATSWDRARTLYRQANFDTLTGLLNRQAFSDRLAQCIDSTRRRATQGAVLFMDLDRFKLVNDTEGHLAGDRVLKEIASRLAAHVRSTDIVARLGGDEFAVIVPEYDVETELDALCKKIIEDIRYPVQINRTDYSLDVSIGVSLFPRDGTDVSALLMRADVAMYKVKERAGSSFAFFDEQLNLAASQRIVVESELKKALLGGALGVQFQPKVELKDLRVVGLEALIRWPDKGFGSFTPDEFVPVAEETGLIHEFTDVLVVETLRCMEQCQRRGYRLDRVALNLSAKQFAQPGLAERFLELVSRHGGSPVDFEIELDESLFLRESASVITELRSLRSAGVTIALDDFGTGYSSLNMLRSLPLDVVKIDRSFIAPLVDTPAARNIAQRVIEIAQSLSLEVVAEGVETDEELRILQSIGCELAQGFVISKPLRVSDLLPFLSQRGEVGGDRQAL